MPGRMIAFRSRTGAAALALSALAAAGSSAAASLSVEVEIPRMDVAEYHRPYVAVWIEREDRSVASNLAAWYMLGAASGNATGKDGTEWLPDLRQWWRRSGRELELPVDGVTGATRPVGVQRIEVPADDPRLAALEPGSYQLVVEAVREVGGRELLRLPLAWPPTETRDAQVQGESELGRVRLTASP